METTTAPEQTEASACSGGYDTKACASHVRAVRDALDILSGKWKIPIIGALRMGGKKRFRELLRDVEGITAKMLSKELKELEINQLVKRTVLDTMPVTVEYELTDYGSSLEVIIKELAEWGRAHRRRIMSS